MTSLLEAYSGDRAKAYDDVRSSSPRWRAETQAMERLLAEIRPRLVLDCPFGTGRWIPQYTAVSCDVIGVDLSDDMLAEARAKVAALRSSEQERFRLRLQSIFELSLDSPDVPDLVVCIRFLNWIPYADAQKALGKLTAIGSQNMIIGVSVVPAAAGLLARAIFRIALAWVNLRSRGAPRQHVHAEAQLLSQLHELGWDVIGQEETLRSTSRVNYFYRLTRRVANAA